MLIKELYTEIPGEETENPGELALGNSALPLGSSVSNYSKMILFPVPG
jgi:hypothetical protein